jgi:hypothetical protein
MADDTALPSIPPAPLVAIAGWLVPGAGYLLIGQRSRGITIGVSILSLFFVGLLVGGVRVIEVPGYVTETGKPHMIDVQVGSAAQNNAMIVRAWSLKATPINEIRDKPWSLPQLMAGPIAIGAGAWSVLAAAPDPARQGQPYGALTHARVNEIGSLYLSVAGLLNLMVIIDAAHRSVHLAERRAAAGAAE